MDIGINLASEAHGPDELIDVAVKAEEAGFDFATISDHYHPWTTSQGESPFVWGTLGGLARETDDLAVGTMVTCPLIRHHPAIIAQAAATAQVMFDGRFFLGVGTGERLNEHVLGDYWPPHEVRLEMLEEAVDIMRTLWDGEMVNHRGDHYTVENAQVFTLPEDPPDIVVSGLGPRTAAAAGEFGDGFVATSPDAELRERYEDGGGDGPRYGGMKVCYADSEAEGVETAYEWWPNTGLSGGGQELPTPAHFEEAVETVTEDDVAEAVVAGPDPEGYVERIREYEAAGYDRVYLHQTGPRQTEFVDFAAEHVLPAFD